MKYQSAFFISIFVASTLFPYGSLNAQSAKKENRKLFQEDSRQSKQAEIKKERELIKTDPTSEKDDLDFQAPEINYDKEKGTATGKGGIILSNQGMQLQADEATVNLTTKDTEASGNVVLSEEKGKLSADKAKVNVNSETGLFEKAEFKTNEGAFTVNADTAEKLSDVSYELKDSIFTTCDCEDGEKPWSIRSSRAHITQEEYAHTYNTTLRFYGLPILYTPYLAFPVKQERTSGLLVPDFGYSSRDGFRFKQPIYIVTDDNTDFTLTPFTETRTRTGASIEARKAFSLYNNFKGRWYYSDESARDGELRGIVNTGSYTPTFDVKRNGGFIEHVWSSEPDSDIPYSIVSDIHYVGDDLMLREIPDDDVGLFNSRYLTSTMVMRVGLGDYFGASVGGEYNQAIDNDRKEDDDKVLQRLPEASIDGLGTFRPFGTNSYGLKVVTKGAATVTEFARDVGYDGTRTNLTPALSVPFHYKNYFNSVASLQGISTHYSLKDVGESDNLSDSSNRQTFVASFTTSTALERVYDIDPDSSLITLTSLGVDDQDSKLQRIKNVIEPTIKYTYVPDRNTDDTPFFDSTDRIRRRNVITYGVNSSFLGKFQSRVNQSSPIEELTPEVEDLPAFSFDNEVIPGGAQKLGRSISLRKGEVRELLSFNVRQSYDNLEDKYDTSPLVGAFSDIGVGVGVNPTRSFSLAADSNISPQDGDLNSWSLSSGLRSDRGDALRARYTFVNQRTANGDTINELTNLNQLEGNAEMVLTDRLKLGYYTRHDFANSKSLEQAVAFRLAGECACWHIDLGYTDRINPDKQQFNIRFTFSGLGDITQDVLYRARANDSAS